MSKKYNANEKPPVNICPEEYCYKWQTTSYSPDHPCCTAMRCRRLPVESKYYDPKYESYEPKELKLNEDGLPWFYFTSYDCIVDVLKPKYIKESEALWGKDHWK